MVRRPLVNLAGAPQPVEPTRDDELLATDDMLDATELLERGSPVTLPKLM